MTGDMGELWNAVKAERKERRAKYGVAGTILVWMAASMEV